eukprot:TRINITY_DN5442_c0_g1_i1.p1 TRINITY_DN5442_c0_g1~~TRINITY_DN5442_c0_g1_i1.p1  ORF type:complete len:533 (-),score=63.31 TRINITY_DN5442_c0_g1_i1:1-1566(-)
MSSSTSKERLSGESDDDWLTRRILADVSRRYRNDVDALLEYYVFMTSNPEEITPSVRSFISIEHEYSRRYMSWKKRSDNELVSYLASDGFQKHLVTLIDKSAEYLSSFLKPMQVFPLGEHGCIGESLPWEFEGSCSHGQPDGHDPDLVRTRRRKEGQPNAPLTKKHAHLHSFVCVTDMLFAIYDTGKPLLVHAVADALTSSRDTPNRFYSLIRLMEYASPRACARVSWHATCLLSIMCTFRPARCFTHPDSVKAMVSVYENRSSITFALIHNTQCSFEGTCGVIDFLNMVPILMQLSRVPEGVRMLKSRNGFTAAGVASIAVNLVYHYNSMGDNTDEWEQPLSVLRVIEPAIKSVPCVFYSPRLNNLKAQPCTLAAVAAVEVLALWYCNGVSNVVDGQIPCDGGAESVSEGLGNEKHAFVKMLKRVGPAAKNYEHVLGLIDSIATRTVPKKNDLNVGKALSRREMLCGLGGCLRTTKTEGGKEKPMAVCGNCSSVRYCSSDHQRQDWATHKLFCVRQKQSK